MRQDPSDMQQRILQCIATFVRDNEMPPTNREIGQDVEVHSTGHVDYHLAQLEKKGYLERNARKSRGLRLLPKALELPEVAAVLRSDSEPDTAPPPMVMSHLQLPVLGQIAAGIPLEISPHYDELLDLSAAFARDDLFALRVKGKSMIGDLIDDGDYVIVQKSDTAANGECVVATISGPGQEAEATLKRLYREGPRVRLQPSNPEMQPIYVDAGDLRIQGRVVSVIRTI
ncbi:MAG TPA: transcriptional repressor LexA [Chloroflexota bacterium]|jgi:repressor LexA|nr:transcriptional repressor LexA [Chloroflexota bacterium]